MKADADEDLPSPSNAVNRLSGMRGACQPPRSSVLYSGFVDDCVIAVAPSADQKTSGQNDSYNINTH